MAIEEKTEGGHPRLPNFDQITKEISQKTRGGYRWTKDHIIGIMFTGVALVSLGSVIANHDRISDASGSTRPGILAPLIPGQLNELQPKVEQADSVEQTILMLQELEQESTEITEIRGSWTTVGTSYTVQDEKESISDIAEKTQTTPEKITQLNNLNYPFNPSNFYKSQVFLVPITPIPSPFFGELFDAVKKDLAELKQVKESKGVNSPEAKALAKKIYADWQSAPEKDTPVKSPEIDIDPDATNGSMIDSEIKEIVDQFPNLGRIVKKFSIDNWKLLPDYDFPAFMWDYEDGAQIVIRNTFTKNGKADWPRNDRIERILHEIGHAANIYGNNTERLSRFVPKAELIKFANRNTIIQDERAKLFNPKEASVLFEDEEFAWSVAQGFTGKYSPFSSPLEAKMVKERLEFNNAYLSTILGSGEQRFDIFEKGKLLGLHN